MDATNQHYVPQFLLRNFASSASGKQIFVFDKVNERSFSDSIKNVASAKAFYDCEVEGAPHSVDPLLTKMESVVSNIIRDIVDARSLRVLSDTGRKMVALFATVQMIRTDVRRKQLKGMSDDVYNAIEQIGGDPSKVEGFDFLNEEQARAASITSLRTLAADLLPHFLNKSWILHGTTQEHPFYISDNPVTKFNGNQHPFLSTLGLRSPGIEIYLPLSSTLSLGFLCPTLENAIRDSYDLARGRGHQVPSHVEDLIRAFGGEAPCTLDPANVTHHNSLQVFNAERFVFAKSDSFDLVREMLQSAPELRNGPRWV